ncbi:putative MFS family arabinose efflux permease [Lacibacter cauensis]|uniref:Putative MFS family arabinose efflux permease n=1 Tax=Lacibacter cauensis TaxID=510947 RepID=A0A562SFI5_9BACT|nr:MFS transporter [Lacibacter cauensis]TWI79494.1 putative MFS family arabinose efflux permease [Lacibacter cauensis]
MSKNERLIIALLAAINFTHILDFMIMMPLGNYLMPYFKISPQQFTFLVGAYTLTAGVSGFTAAFFVNNYDRKKVLLYGYTGFLLGTIACGIAPTFELLLAARILAGMFGGLIGAQVLSIVADIIPYERRGAAMGAIMSAFAVASTFGVPFSLYLANIISWHAPFLFVGIVGVVIIPLVSKYLPSMSGHIKEKEADHNKFEVLQVVVENPTQRLALLFSFLMMMGHFLIIPFINPYMEFNNGYSKTVTPMIYLVGGISSFFAANILGKISDRYGKLPVFSVSVLLSLLFVWVITNLPPVHIALMLSLFAVWFVLATGRSVAAQAMISNVVTPQHRGSFMSFNSSVQQLGTAAASFIAGMIVIKGEDGKIQHYNWLGYLSIVVLVVCFFLARRLFYKMTNQPAFSTQAKKQ